ncbi:MurT ligase domain-containing protein [Kallotenue papyrolyticum]|uniref:MurT ligase domain-containing protein n=1 Tax=Kallotenue papyrolyticum TaxID=1325125 RepID=UPI0023ECE72A|nr:MurT ligase domain-containing protein [Kallotenue papyrolyticum]
MSLSLRRMAGTLAGKTTLIISRGLGRGGTQLPGVVARRIDPFILRELADDLPQGVVLVTGTNGKTTTARMLAAILQRHGWRVLHNRAGANLITGLTATAIAGADAWGRLRAEIGLFETDEAHLPAAIGETQPRVVLVLNLFRDQLDRYGEVDTIAKRWRAALATLPASSTVVLNADDPAVAGLGENLGCRVLYYGLQDTRHGVAGVQHMADSQFCRRCGTAYVYQPAFYGHVGHYHCPACGLTRPTPEVRLQRLSLEGTTGATLALADEHSAWEIRLPLPGLYNALNATAAAAAARALAIPPDEIRAALEQFSAAFGRLERLTVGGRELLMALIKNPVGASETVRMLVGARGAAGPLALLIVINDKIADGTDVSWLWDADFEQLAERVEQVVVSGTRAEDMAVRLKYAGVPPERIVVEPALARALDRALALAPADQPLYLLPTYTAMLELREELVRRGLARPFWED